MSEFIKWFKEINKNSIAIAGGKGANLGEMASAHFPIPPGFIITAQAYHYFITTTKIADKIQQLLKGLDVEDTEKLQNTAETIQKLIIATPIPNDIKEAVADAYSILGVEFKTQASTIMQGTEEFVAVRSSATAEDLPEASFAGQQATYLNIKGRQNVINAVRECWASLFTARAIYYRQKNNFPHDKVLIAVVVQRMVNSERSGVMFTINPATNKDDEIVIEAAHGLGETVVSGEVTPDLYIVDKNTNRITTCEVKEQKFKLVRDPATGKNVKKLLTPDEEKLQVLSDKLILELARYGKKIHDHYGKPQDIEWAIERDRVYIVQSRAVTTFKPQKQKSREPTGSRELENAGRSSSEDITTTSNEILLRGETASSGTASGPVRIILSAHELNKVQQGDILVTKMTNPDMVPAMERAVAIITDEGGMTSHAAIVSREIGIPCVVGTEKATKVLKNDQLVTVDATNGIIYSGKTTAQPTPTQLQQPPQHTASSVQHLEEPVTATKIKVIMDFPKYAEQVAQQTEADGVGLLRLEFIIAGGGKHPAEYIRENKDSEYTALLVNEIKKVAQAFKDKPVWARCSDIRTDEYRNLPGGKGEPHESDPMIGWHGIRRLLDEPRMLKAEFAAIKQLHDEGYKNVGIMLPFVIRADEVKKAKEILREVGLEPGKEVEFGVMIETPASCWVIEEICKEGINFISFGTNDLTQLTLGIDRNNQKIQKLYDEMHPAVLGELAMVINVCKRYGVETSICGQAGSRPEMAEFLIKQGIDSISPNPDAVHNIRHIVAQAEKKILLDAERKVR